MSAPAWHALAVAEAADRCGCEIHSGLSTQQVADREARWGPNELPRVAGPGLIRRVFGQLRSPLILVLLAAAGVTIAMGQAVDAVVILAVVVINAVVGTIQEGQAQRELSAVHDLLPTITVVLRDGERRAVPVAALVPGDVVLLEAGSRVPADLRVVAAHNLSVEESLLTGESAPVGKSPAPCPVHTDLSSRSCMAYSGTMVATGTGTGVVVATGSATALGGIQAMMREATALATPLTRQLTAFARQITVFILAISGVAFAALWWLRGAEPLPLLQATVGMAVAAIPEGLPAVITVILAIAARQMSRRNAIVRQLPAVEALGSVTVLCTDKTGTLTRNEMTATHLLLPDRELTVTGVGYEAEGGFRDARRGPVDPAEVPGAQQLLEAVVLCNDAHVAADGAVTGDPTEVALLMLARKAGIDVRDVTSRHPRLDEIPFDSDQRYMATLHHDHRGHAETVVKGAPERVLQMCAAPDPQWRQAATAAADRGERVLALATRTDPLTAGEELTVQPPSGLAMIGLIGLSDPPREGSRQAVADCHHAGVRVIMITGDHPRTAAAVGADLGLAAAAALSGSAVADLSDDELVAALSDTDIVARASPAEKLRLVRVLQARGDQVAMTGDGANDAPALKAADIGVAMGGRGTDVAREAADLVLVDDDFSTLVAAVREGRVVYENLRKSLVFMLPTNGGESLLLLAALIFALTLPVTVPQILWVNLVTSVTLALALAFEPASSAVMDVPPRRPGTPLLTRPLIVRVAVVSVLLVIMCLAVFEFEMARSSDVEAARTATVTVLVFAELLYLFQSRDFARSTLRVSAWTGNRVAILAAVVLVAIQLLFVYAPPLQVVFDTEGLDGPAWLTVGVGGVAFFGAVEVVKGLTRRRAAGHRSSRQ